MKIVISIAVLAVCVGLAACARPGATNAAKTPPTGLLGQFQNAFAKSNPRISHVHVLNLISDAGRPGHEYAALVTGLTSTPVDLSDEMFGVFVVDSTLTRVQRVLEIIPSGRLLDYAVVMKFSGPDTLVVRGFGMMDQGASFRHAFHWPQ
jgi:hypothetical protein